MKIGQQQPEVTPAATQPVQPASGQQVGPSTYSSSSGRTERGTRAASAPSVGVTVSESARALESAAADSSVDVDTEKVNAVRQAIENKTFIVNPETIADRLLANAREMLQRSAS